MRYPSRITFREVFATVKDANAVLPFMEEDSFAEKFAERVSAIGDALVVENGWTNIDLARMRHNPDLILNVELGAESTERFEEFKEWFVESVSFYG